MMDLVEQEVIIHLGEQPALLRKRFDGGDFLLGATADQRVFPEAGYFGQGRDLVPTIWWRRRRQKDQLIEGVVALASESGGPPRSLPVRTVVEGSNRLRGATVQLVEAQPRRCKGGRRRILRGR